MRRDLRPIRPDDEAAIELKLLTGRRSDLVEDRTRSVNRLRGTLLSMFPALERVLDDTNTGPLKLLTGFQTPAAIRRAGVTRLTKWLANRSVRNARTLAETAVEAAGRQYTAIAGEKTIARLVHTLAEEVMALNEQIREMDKLIEGRFREHELADIVQSHGTRARSAATSTGPWPTTGACNASSTPPRSSASLRRELAEVLRQERGEGKKHVQAVLALARRRVNVLWALIRDRRCYEITPPVTATA